MQFAAAFIAPGLVAAAGAHVPPIERSTSSCAALCARPARAARSLVGPVWTGEVSRRRLRPARTLDAPQPPPPAPNAPPPPPRASGLREAADLPVHGDASEENVELARYLIETLDFTHAEVEKVKRGRRRWRALRREQIEEVVAELTAGGLEPQDVPRVLAQCPSILAVGRGPLRDKVRYFHELGVLGRNFRRMCRLFPAILTLDVEGHVRPNLDLLRNWGADPVKVLMTTRAAGLRRENLLSKLAVFQELAARREDVHVALKVYPRILMRSRAGLLDTIGKLRGIGYTPKALAMVLRHYPAMYSVSPDFIEQRMRFFRQQGFSPPQLAAAMARSPGLLTVPADKVRAAYAFFGESPDPPGGGEAVADFEEEDEGDEEAGFGPFEEEGGRLGMPRADVTKMLTRAPKLLDLSLETSVALKIGVLRDLGLDSRGVAAVLRAAPTVLHLSLEDTWLPRIRFLESLGIPRSDVARMIRTKPGVLYASMEGKVEPLIAYLRSRGASDAQVARILAGCPTALALDLESNIKPKASRTPPRPSGVHRRQVEYLASRGYDMDAVAAFPSALHRSLESRLRPRLELARLHPRLAGRSLGALLPPSDAAFERAARVPPALAAALRRDLAAGPLDEERWRGAIAEAVAEAAAAAAAEKGKGRRSRKGEKSEG